MENAAKALLIVAGVILGVILLSLMVYVFRQGASVNEAYDQKQRNLQLELYNSKFENYDRNNNNIMDIISLCNLAFDVNMDTNFDSTRAVQIEVDIGNKTFILPNNNTINERNKILDNHNSPISIYDLVEKTLDELDIGSLTHDATDKLSTTKLIPDTGKRIYKYLFEVSNPDDFKYHAENTRVSSIKLTAYVNPDWSI